MYADGWDAARITHPYSVLIEQFEKENNPYLKIMIYLKLYDVMERSPPPMVNYPVRSVFAQVDKPNLVGGLDGKLELSGLVANSKIMTTGRPAVRIGYNKV